MAQFLHPEETVTSSGFGALLVSGMRPIKGKVYLTSLRLAFIPDEPVTPIWCHAWNKIANVRIKKGLMGATAFVTAGGGEMGVDSTKAIAGDIERAWLGLKTAVLPVANADPQFLPSIDVRCGGCGSQLPPASWACPRCLRRIVWPEPLNTLAEVENRPDLLLPAKFPDGSDTQRGAIAQGLATFSVAAICTGQMGFNQQIASLVDAMVSRDPLPPEEFGDMPRIPGIGDPDNNNKFWLLARRSPQRLAN